MVNKKLSESVRDIIASLKCNGIEYCCDCNDFDEAIKAQGLTSKDATKDPRAVAAALMDHPDVRNDLINLLEEITAIFVEKCSDKDEEN